MRILGYVIIALVALACIGESVCDWIETANHCDETVACSLCLQSAAVTQPAPTLPDERHVICTVAVEVPTLHSLQRPPLTPPPRA